MYLQDPVVIIYIHCGTTTLILAREIGLIINIGLMGLRFQNGVATSSPVDCKISECYRFPHFSVDSLNKLQKQTINNKQLYCCFHLTLNINVSPNNFHLWSQQCIFSTKTRLIVGKKFSTLFESQQCIISTTKRLIVAKRIVVNSSYILLLQFVCERQRFIKLNVKGQEDKRLGVAEGSRAEVAPPTDRVINMGVIP